MSTDTRASDGRGTSAGGPVAVVTGANRGLGLAVVRALCAEYPGTVYLTARDEPRGRAAAAALTEPGPAPLFHQLDVTDADSVRTFAEFIRRRHGGLDVLVNNAGILEWDEVYPTYETAKRTIDTNYRSLLLMEEFVYPLLRDGARVVNISSAGAHLSNLRNKDWLDRLTRQDLTTEDIDAFVDSYLDSVKNGTFDRNDFADEGKHAEYRVSKIAALALTFVQQRKYDDRNISINAFHPGHMQTDMAHGLGGVDPAEAARTVLYLVREASPLLRGVLMWGGRRLLDWYDVGGDYFYKHQG